MTSSLSVPDTASTSNSEISASAPNPITLQHVLNLPEVLHQINPYLAALHIARIRLLSTQTTENDGLGSAYASIDLSKIGKEWCKSCGGIRERQREREGGRGVKGKRKGIGGNTKKECSLCGAIFGRASTLKTPPARRVMRTRAKDRSLITADTPAVTPFPGLETIETPKLNSAIPQTNPGLSSRSPSVLSSPKLLYIPKEDPNPPTYPQPGSSSPSLGSPSSVLLNKGRISTGISTSKGSRKKGKKSGLAKLLAASREREDGEKLGGWGFG